MSKNESVSAAPMDNCASDIGRKIIDMIGVRGWVILWQRVHGVPDDAWPIDIINAEVAALVEQARREEREACAAIAEHEAEPMSCVVLEDERVRQNAGHDIAAAIRARAAT